jgi:putative restriction endonuclease
MVKLFVALTDLDWFNFLSARPGLDEVNFWQPSGRTMFRALQGGELFLFKLHSPNDFIVGGGIFAHASQLPISLAWEAFGQANGAESLQQIKDRVARYRRERPDPRIDHAIGCRLLEQPFFLPREGWIPAPRSWSSNIVVGKRFDTAEEDGRYLWDAVQERLSLMAPFGGSARFGAPRLIEPRLGQGTFRIAVTDSYERRCALTGEKTLPILDAAHIRAYNEGGTHSLDNGVLLRTDIHRLFDRGYVTVSLDGRFEVGRRLKEDFDNGRHYYDLHGQRLRAPLRPTAQPAREALEWHHANRFLG